MNIKSAQQCASTVLMVRPRTFTYNHETELSNRFQAKGVSIQLSDVLKEFDSFVMELESKSIKVIVIEEKEGGPVMPDAIYPNNWFSTHVTNVNDNLVNGSDSKEKIDCLCLYSLAAPNRRMERLSLPVASYLQSNYNILRQEEFGSNEKFLEGTGSMVLDRVNRIAYAAKSVRTDTGLVDQWCKAFDYEPVIFETMDSDHVPIYHTNVMLSIGMEFVIVCEEVIKGDKDKIIRKLSHGDSRRVIRITESQMRTFAGNVLEVVSNDGKSVVVMSQQAWNAMSDTDQIFFRQTAELVIPDIKSIETIGGGSCRCMLAEIFSHP